LKILNPNFVIKIVARVLNVWQIGISGYFLGEKCLTVLKLKNVHLSVAAKDWGAALVFQLQNPC